MLYDGYLKVFNSYPLQTTTASSYKVCVCCGSLHRLASVGTGGFLVSAVPLHQLRDVELGLLQHFHLANEAIFNGEDGGCLARDLITNGCTDKLLDQGLQVALGAELGHDRNHLGTNRPDLRRLGVAGVFDLILLLASEGNAKHADNVAIRRPAVHVAFDDRLFLSDQAAELVPSHVHAMKVHEAVEALHVLNA